MAKPSAVEKVRVTLHLPADLVTQAKHYCLDARMNLQDLVAELLREKLGRVGKKGGR